MPQTVQLEDGRVLTFPDYATPELITQQIGQQLQQDALARQYRQPRPKDHQAASSKQDWQTTPPLENLAGGEGGVPKLQDLSTGGRSSSENSTWTRPGKLENLAGGAKHEWDRAAMGLKSWFTDLTPEDKALLEQGKAFSDQGGPWATAGQMGADMALAAPFGAIAGAAGKGLSLLPKIGKLLQIGKGRILGSGLAARGAVEGAGIGALTADQGDSGSEALKGAAFGAALPLALSKAGATVGGLAASNLFPGGALAGPAAFHSVADAVAARMPWSKTSAARLNKALRQNLGSDQVDAAIPVIQGASPSRFAETPATLTSNPTFAQLEAGARQRNPDFFASGDLQNANEILSQLKAGTPLADMSTRDALVAGRGQKGNALTRQKAQANFRGQFVSDRGIPRTPDVLLNDAGSLPDINGVALRKALAQQGAGLGPEAEGTLNALSNNLDRLQLPQRVPRGEPIDFASLRPPAANAFSRIGATRAVIDSMYRGADNVTRRQIDTAIANPQKFIEAVTLASQSRPLAPWERTLANMILMPGRGAASASEPQQGN